MPNSNYIVKELQKYKSYWQYILDKKIHLDFVDGEIKIILARSPGGYVVLSKQSMNRPEVLDRLTIEKKRRVWNKIRRIEYWLKQLSLREREAIFWRYIQHDFEPSPYYQQNNLALKWKTLSWEEIAKKMRVSVAAVREYVDRGLSKIQELVEAYTRSD
jgi:hypothetical protein